MKTDEVRDQIRDLFRQGATFWQVHVALADVMEESTKESPSHDYRLLPEMLRKHRKEMAELCGRGD